MNCCGCCGVTHGIVTVATPTATPTVRLRDDLATTFVVRNVIPGYTPVVGHSVQLVVEQNKIVSLNGKL